MKIALPRTKAALFAICFGLLISPLAQADDGNPAYTDPEKAPVDFQYQGEYLGTATEDSSVKIGLQVIALSDGRFETVAYIGGLPGAGWERGDKVHRGVGELDGDRVLMKGDDVTAVIEDGKVVAKNGEGDVVARLEKVTRKSPTLGKKAPEGALVLFDGTSADAFENGKIVEGDLLAATGCFSKAKFNDHTLHIEFRTPYMPKSRGQARGNSGVYMQSRYELQVLDSFGLEGKNNECGGIYSISEPIVNMCLPPLSWQTYDIDFTAAKYNDAGEKTASARATIRHNGVVIHDDLELTHGTPGRFPEAAGPEALFLQDHGNPVVFRNIWVVEK